jgi:hypothetical protein
MEPSVHPTAIVDETAVLGSGTVIEISLERSIP